MKSLKQRVIEEISKLKDKATVEDIETWVTYVEWERVTILNLTDDARQVLKTAVQTDNTRLLLHVDEKSETISQLRELKLINFFPELHNGAYYQYFVNESGLNLARTLVNGAWDETTVPPPPADPMPNLWLP